MRWNDVQSNWAAFVPTILTQWPELEEDDVLTADGDREAFTRLIAERFELDQAGATGEVDEWLMGMQPSDTVMDESRDNERILDSARSIPPGEDVYDEDGEFGDEGAQERPLGNNA